MNRDRIHIVAWILCDCPNDDDKKYPCEISTIKHMLWQFDVAMQKNTFHDMSEGLVQPPFRSDSFFGGNSL